MVHYLLSGSGPLTGPLFCNFLCKITPSETPRIASLAPRSKTWAYSGILPLNRS
jgi:hypothetical protein